MPTNIISTINFTDPSQSNVEAFSMEIVEPFSMATLLGVKAGTIDDDVSASIDDDVSASIDEPSFDEKYPAAQLDFHSVILSPELVQYSSLPSQPIPELPLQLLKINSGSNSEVDSVSVEPEDNVTDNSSDTIANVANVAESWRSYVVSDISVLQSSQQKVLIQPSNQLEEPTTEETSTTVFDPISRRLESSQIKWDASGETIQNKSALEKPAQLNDWQVVKENNQLNLAELINQSPQLEPKAQRTFENLAEQVYSPNEVLLTAKENNNVMLQQQTGIPVFQMSDFQPKVINHDKTVEELTTSLSQFLTHGMSSLPQSGSDNFYYNKTTNVDVAPKMSFLLTSLQPEVLAQGVSYQTENYTAQIKVHPQDLGPITAQIEVSQGATNITFVTEHAHVKQLMEVNLKELHQAFQDSSLNLTTVNVHHSGSQDKRDQHSSSPKPFEEEDSDLKVNQPTINSRENHTINSIIDTYA